MNSGNNIPNDPQHGQPFSRDWIDAVRRGKTIPENADAFDRDALEGWQRASGGKELLRKTDRRFLRSARWIYATVSVFAVILVLGLIFYPQSHVQSVSKSSQKVSVDKADLILPKEIERMKELPKEMQIRPAQVVQTFKEKKAENIPLDHEALHEIPGLLPIRRLTPGGQNKQVTISRKQAKEINLSGMKLVDYRAYRSKPQIPTEQILLTGTPADQASAAINEEDPDWKPVDVPYYDFIAQTMEQFARGNYKQTLNRTESILQFYPDDINALFYGGLCYYNLHETDKAIAAFQRVIANSFSNFDEEALWHLAKAYDLNGEKSKATELYEFIASQKGFYAAQAEKVLRK